MEPYIDISNDKVYCSKCDGEMTNVTYFTKVQMKTLKQFKVKTQKSFSVKCQSCGKEDRPILNKEDILCPSCKKPYSHLTESFKIMLRDKLKTVSHDL